MMREHHFNQNNPIEKLINLDYEVKVKFSVIIRLKVDINLLNSLKSSQLIFTCSKSIMKTLEKGVKFAQK